MLGRRRYFPNLAHPTNVNIKNREEREAINAPIQGTAADIMKLAMIQLLPALQKAKLSGKMLLQVHDELVFNVVPEELEIIQKEIPHIMEHIIQAPIELKVDMGIGKNWRETK